jgi:glycosyltransferase involved in cell wall biosynthesis
MISVIIPAFNEEKAIVGTLDSLVEQKYKKKFEVILVNNNSTDGTVKSAKKFLKKLNLKIVNEKRQGRGAAKARGAREARGDTLAYLDADTRASKNWLSTIENYLSDDVVAITGPWRVYDLPNGFTKKFLYKFQHIAMLPIRAYLGCQNLNGMNMAFSKDDYKKSGGFDAGLNVHDDFDIAKKLKHLGEIKYLPNLIVYTSGRRYKNGIVRGILSYHKNTIGFLLGKRGDLEDIR